MVAYPRLDKHAANVKRGSFRVCCISSKKVHQLEDSQESSSDENCLSFETMSTTLACQLDTGATCNALCLDDLSAITQLGDPPIKNSSVKLKLFGGSTMKPIGVCDLHIKHNDTKHVLKFQVIQDKCKPLLSAETCEKLQLIQLNVHQLNDSVVPEPLSKEELMRKFHDVFNGLGHIGDAKIVVDQSVTPVQHSPRRVPVALRKDVERKILELEEKGIITKAVEPSQWISSMVVVAKPQKIRICLDPKDLNRAIQHSRFQMPTLEELLPELSKARIFSSFDAKDGFYQVSLDEDSSKLTTFWTPLGRYECLSLAPEVFESKL